MSSYREAENNEILVKVLKQIPKRQQPQAQKACQVVAEVEAFTLPFLSAANTSGRQFDRNNPN